MVYTDMESSLLSEAKSTRLLPFHRTQFAPPAKEKAVQEPFEFYPSVEAVLNSMIPSYVSGFLYSALLDSFCSEQNARMTAMDAANQNAEELLSALAAAIQPRAAGGHHPGDHRNFRRRGGAAGNLWKRGITV